MCVGAWINIFRKRLTTVCALVQRRVHAHRSPPVVPGIAGHGAAHNCPTPKVRTEETTQFGRRTLPSALKRQISTNRTMNQSTNRPCPRPSVVAVRAQHSGGDTSPPWGGGSVSFSAIVSAVSAPILMLSRGRCHRVTDLVLSGWLEKLVAVRFEKLLPPAPTTSHTMASEVAALPIRRSASADK